MDNPKLSELSQESVERTMTCNFITTAYMTAHLLHDATYQTASLIRDEIQRCKTLDDLGDKLKAFMDKIALQSQVSASHPISGDTKGE